MLEQLRIRLQHEAERLRVPRTRGCLRIIDRDVQRHPTEIESSKTFGDAERLGMRVAAVVEPAAFSETGGLDGERIPFPAAHRVAVVRRVGIDGQRPAVGVNLPVLVELFVQNDGDTRRLNDLRRRLPERILKARRSVLLILTAHDTFKPPSIPDFRMLHGCLRGAERRRTSARTT
jgi:hypothetical protein